MIKGSILILGCVGVGQIFPPESLRNNQAEAFAHPGGLPDPPSILVPVGDCAKDVAAGHPDGWGPQVSGQALRTATRWLPAGGGWPGATGARPGGDTPRPPGHGIPPLLQRSFLALFLCLHTFAGMDLQLGLWYHQHLLDIERKRGKGEWGKEKSVGTGARGRELCVERPLYVSHGVVSCSWTSTDFQMFFS